jgi:ubiquinone/menaquinone biosynthesis C-methylase UbiE
VDEPFDQMTRSAYDEIAADFARVNGAMPESSIAAADWLCSRVPPGSRVLDVGCGAGRDMAWLSSRGLRVTGADLSAGMLAPARSITTGPLCQMDMRSLGFASQSFQAAWCSAALLHLPKALAPQALSEMARVLVPGGCLYLAVQAGSEEVVQSGEYGHPQARRFFARYRQEEMREMVQQAGFTVIEDGEYLTNRIWLGFKLVKG